MKLNLIALLTVATLAIAQEPAPTPNPNVITFYVACGSSSGTYEALLDQLQPILKDSVQFIKYTNKPSDPSMVSTGALDNLDHLINNDVQAAFMHNDVPDFRKRGGENMDKFKTLLALHREEVHLLALSNSGLSTGSFWHRQPVVFNTIDDLAGYTIGAAGGGRVTMKKIKVLTDIPYHIREFETGAEVIAALDRGDIQCALFVGGAPLPNLKDLGPKYKLLSIPDSRKSQLQGVYRPASITYTKMRPESVSTVSADCLLMAQDYKTPQFRKAEKDIREAFYQHLDEIKESRGTHAKWQEVDPTYHGPWPWLELK